ncbi:MAG: LptA/OstA family protein [Oceanicaulis sp.]
MISSISTALAGSAAAIALAASALAQSAPGQGPIDISADNLDGYDREGRVVYSGDVNALRGDTRLRSDRLEVLFTPREGAGGFGDIRRIIATGDVFYVTPQEIARGDRGVYDLEAGTITLEGSVVLTQGCNVSTGERLVADLDGGSARLSGGGAGESQRVRSVFFEDSETRAAAPAPGECPDPVIPGDGPRPFEPQN